MISAQAEKGFLQAHWDYVVAAAGALALAGAAVFLFLEYSVNPDDAAANVKTELASGARAETGVETVDMTPYALAFREVKSPSKLIEPAETLGSFLASERRVFCEQGDDTEHKSCGQPMPADLKTCPLCGTAQPKEKKIDLDSDGDGLSDEWETANGLNPNDPSDIDQDLDGDGFTVREELAAGTDFKDPASHPDYLDYVTLNPELKQTSTTLMFVRTYKTPSGRKFDFKDPKRVKDYDRGNYSVYEGGEIGKSGFIVRGYEEKSRKEKMGGGMEKTVDISEAIVERKADKKVVRLVVNAKRTPIDVQATLVFNRGETPSFTVGSGSEIELHGSKYKVKEISGATGGGVSVTLKNLANGRERIIKTP